MKKNILAKSCCVIFILLTHTFYTIAQPAAPVVTPYVVACGSSTFSINATPPVPGQQVRWYNNFYMQTLLSTGNTYTGTATQSQTFYASTYDPGTGLQSTYPATAYVFVPQPPVVHATPGIDPVTNCLGTITVNVDTAFDSVSTVPIADAYVMEATPTTNYGTLTYMIIWAWDIGQNLNNNLTGYVSDLYMKFDLSQIPPNVTIVNSNITMTDNDAFAWGGDGNIYSQFVSDDTWTETGINWNNKPATAPSTVNSIPANYMYWVWGADYGFEGYPATGGPGGTAAGAPITTHISGSGFSTLGLQDTGIIASTQSEYAGDKILSLAMESPGYNTRWYTKEYTGNVAQIPYLNVHFAYNSTNSTYSWSGPNGFTSTQESISGLLAGTYTLTTTNAYNCITITTVSVTNIPIDTTVLDTFCTGSGYMFAGHTYTTGGTYTNTFTNVSGCDSVVTLNLYALPQPTVTATNNSPFCINGTNVLDLFVNTSPGATYSWTGPGGFMSNQQNPIITAPTPANGGVYSVAVTLPTGCTASGSTVVSILPGPPPPLTYDITYCQYDAAVPLNAIGSDMLWYTTLPPGGAGDTVTPVPSTQNPGTYTWYVTQTAPNGCISTPASVHVKVNFKAKFTIAADSSVCLDSNTSFRYNGTTPPPTAVYAWSAPRTTAITGSANTSSLSVTFDSIGTHTIFLSVSDDSNGLCTATDSLNIYVAPPPVASFTLPTDACIGQPVNVVTTYGTPDIANDGYVWTFNGANVLSGSVPGPGPYSVSYQGMGTYQVSLTAVSRYGCPAPTITDTINIHPTPQASIDSISATSVCTGDSIILLTDSANYDKENSYVWSPKGLFIIDGNTTSRVMAKITASTEITLTVTTPFGCADSTSIPIIGKSCCGVYFPTAFTPGNSDNINIRFRPITIGHHNIEVFRIVNRWGQVVYSSSNEEQGWDGTLNGVPQDTGDYFWYIKYQCSNGSMVEDKGVVTLLR